MLLAQCLATLLALASTGGSKSCTCYYCGGTSIVKPGDAGGSGIHAGDRCPPPTSTCSQTEGKQESGVCYSPIEDPLQCACAEKTPVMPPHSSAM